MMDALISGIHTIRVHHSAMRSGVMERWYLIQSMNAGGKRC